MVSSPFDRVAFNKVERRWDTGAEIGFVDGTGVDWLICVFTIVDEGLFAVANVEFPLACARIWATSGDILSSDKDEKLGVTVDVGFVEAKDTSDIVELLVFTDGSWFDTDEEAF